MVVRLTFRVVKVSFVTRSDPTTGKEGLRGPRGPLRLSLEVTDRGLWSPGPQSQVQEYDTDFPVLCISRT